MAQAIGDGSSVQVQGFPVCMPVATDRRPDL